MIRTVSAAVILTCLPAFGQQSHGPARGVLIVDGGGATDAPRNRFVALAGGASARIVVIPTGASLVRVAEGKTVVDPDWPRDRPEWSAYEADLKQWLGSPNVTILHTRDRAAADSERFVQPMRNATGVVLLPGNPGRYAAAYLDTRTERELRALLDRGGVIYGCSAGSIILGSFIVRGLPGKPVLMARGHERGFGFLSSVAIDPHLTQAKRETELVNVVDAHPDLLGIGIDEDAALLVEGDRFEVIGTGRVAIYDNVQHDLDWYYWLKPGDRFDLAARRKAARQ